MTLYCVLYWIRNSFLYSHLLGRFICYLYLCTHAGIQHDFHINIVSLNSKTTGATDGAGLTYPSRAYLLTLGFSVFQSLVLCVVFYRSLFINLSFTFGHCIVCPSSFDGLRLPLLYRQTFLIIKVTDVAASNILTSPPHNSICYHNEVIVCQITKNVRR